MHYICSANPQLYKRGFSQASHEGYTKYYCTPVGAFFKARPINSKVGQEIMGGELRSLQQSCEPVSPNFSICTTIHYERLKDFNYKRICIVENEGKSKFKSSPDKPFMIHVSINEKDYKDNKYYYTQIDQTELPQTVLNKVQEIEEKYRAELAGAQAHYMGKVDVKPTDEEKQEMFDDLCQN
jgi:hypothetical protein